MTLSVYYTESVTVTFHQDGIAQEPDETFNLTLALRVEPTPREGIYLRDTIQMTIIDRDSKGCKQK